MPHYQRSERSNPHFKPRVPRLTKMMKLRRQEDHLFQRYHTVQDRPHMKEKV